MNEMSFSTYLNIFFTQNIICIRWASESQSMRQSNAHPSIQAVCLAGATSPYFLERFFLTFSCVYNRFFPKENKKQHKWKLFKLISVDCCCKNTKKGSHFGLARAPAHSDFLFSIIPNDNECWLCNFCYYYNYDIDFLFCKQNRIFDLIMSTALQIQTQNENNLAKQKKLKPQKNSHEQQQKIKA